MWLASLRSLASGQTIRSESGRKRPVRRAGYQPRVESLENRIVLATIRWMNPAGGSWHVARNWDLQRVPAAGDDVEILLPGTYTVTHSVGSNTIGSLDSLRTVGLTGGTLTVARQVQGAHTLVIEGGTLRGATVARETIIQARGVGGQLWDVTLHGNTEVVSPGNPRLGLVGNWRNNGTILVTNGSLAVAGIIATASLGDIRSTGGVVDLIGTLENAGATLALNRTTGSWRLDSGTINGGSLTTSDGTNLVVHRGHLNGITVNGDMQVKDILDVSNGMSLNGTLTLGDADAGRGGVLVFAGSQTLAGLGTVALGILELSRIETTEGLLTIGSGITVRGSGRLLNINNLGTIQVDTPGRSLTLTGNPWQNSGVLRLTAGSLNLDGSFSTASFSGIQRDPNTTLTITGTLQNSGSTLTLNASTGSVRLFQGTIRGGTITSMDGAALLPTNGINTLDGVTINTSLEIPQGTGLVLGGPWRNNSTLRVTGGQLVMGGVITVPALGTLEQTSGNISLAGTLNNQGTTLNLSTDRVFWTMSGTGSIIGGTVTTGAKSFLRVEGSPGINRFVGVTLNGNLEVVGGVLEITEGFTLDGTLIVGGSRVGEVRFLGSQTLMGSGFVFLLNAGDRFGASSGIVTISPGFTFEMYSGQLVNFLNLGTIHAGNLEGVVLLDGTGWRNEGILRLDAGTLRLGGTFTISSLGNFQRMGGDVLVVGTLNNTGTTLTLDAATGPWTLRGTIDGGTVRTRDEIRLLAGPFASLVGVTLDGDLDVFDTNVNIRNGLTLHGTVTLGRGDGYGGLGFEGTQTLGGTGTILFQGTNVRFNSLAAFPDDATLTIGPNITVRGGGGTMGALGSIGSPRNLTLVIEGTISAETAGQSILLAAVNIHNRGYFQALEGGNLRLERRDPAGTITNEGFAIVGMGSSLTADAAYSQTDGATFLLGGSLSAPRVELQGGFLIGTGTIHGDVHNSASLLVGFDGSPGRLVIQGDYVQTTDGVLDLKLGGTEPGTEHDQLAITGTATLDGTLNITLLDDYFAQPDDTFTLLTFAQRTGKFSVIEGLFPKGQSVYFLPVFEDTEFSLFAMPY